MIGGIDGKGRLSVCRPIRGSSLSAIHCSKSRGKDLMVSVRTRRGRNGAQTATLYCFSMSNLL